MREKGQTEVAKTLETPVFSRGIGILTEKSVIFTQIKRCGRTLILSHRDELVRQPEKYYEGEVLSALNLI